MCTTTLSSLVEIHTKDSCEGHRRSSLQATTFSQHRFIPVGASHGQAPATGCDCCSPISGKRREADVWQSPFVVEGLPLWYKKHCELHADSKLNYFRRHTYRFSMNFSEDS